MRLVPSTTTLPTPDRSFSLRKPDTVAAGQEAHRHRCETYRAAMTNSDAATHPAAQPDE